MTKQKRLKLIYLINVIMIILLFLDYFKVKSLLGDVYIINSSEFISFFQNLTFMSDIFKVVTDLFGTSYLVYACLSMFCVNVVYWCVICLPLSIIDFVKGMVKYE